MVCGVVFPRPKEGIEGCVTVKVACWAEMFLLLFGEEVFFGFGWLFRISGGCAWA